MVFVFVILFTAAAYFTPGLAQTSNAVANANAFVTGGGASASAFSSANYYPYYQGNYDCTYDRCTPTCSIPYPTDCPENYNPCNCPPKTYISGPGGQCVPEEECQKYANCRGDYNAIYRDCVSPCPSTCATPKRSCKFSKCGPGCQCNSGYILSSEQNGRCIKPEECPNAPICGRNETFVTCSVDCPNLYCPVSTTQVACGPSLPCVGDCECKYRYLRKSVADPTCILATECPPGKCYGANEEWNRCVSRCISDSCKDRNKVQDPKDCPFVPEDCTPRCLCKKGFYRNGFDCVPAEECPVNQ